MRVMCVSVLYKLRMSFNFHSVESIFVRPGVWVWMEGAGKSKSRSEIAMESNDRVSPSPTAPAATRFDARAIDGESDARGLGIKWGTKKEMANHFMCSAAHK